MASTFSFFLADDTRQGLESAGATVLGPYPDAAAAFQALESRHADWAVVDVNLGHGPSFEPTRALIGRGVAVVLVTRYDAQVLPPDLATLPRLHKPTDASMIVKAVFKACAASTPSTDKK
jgi:DNA-binding NarL/FixJ family response regulator